MSPAPRTVHQRFVLDLAAELYSFARRHHLGEVFVAPFDVLLSEHDIVQPDVCFVAAERSHIVDAKNCEGVPDLMAEVLSPKTRRHDLVVKRTAYERSGVAEYWIADPEARTVDVLRLGADGRYEAPERLEAEAGDVLATALLPDVALALADLFG